MNVSISIVQLHVVIVFTAHLQKNNFSGTKHGDRVFENYIFKIYFSSCSSNISPSKLTCYTVCLSEGIKQAVSQLVENSTDFCLIVEPLRFVLKVHLGLVMPNQYCQGARMVWLLSDILGPTSITVLLYDNLL